MNAQRAWPQTSIVLRDVTVMRDLWSDFFKTVCRHWYAYALFTIKQLVQFSDRVDNPIATQIPKSSPEAYMVPDESKANVPIYLSTTSSKELC